MTDRELKKLSRKELLDMLIFQAEENKKLKDELEKTKLELLNREISIEKSGSMAEAAMYIAKVFESADKAAQIYLENMELKKRVTDELCEQRLAQAQTKVNDIISGAVNTIRTGSEAYFRSILDSTASAQVSASPAGEEENA